MHIIVNPGDHVTMITNRGHTNHSIAEKDGGLSVAEHGYRTCTEPRLLTTGEQATLDGWVQRLTPGLQQALREHQEPHVHMAMDVADIRVLGLKRTEWDDMLGGDNLVDWQWEVLRQLAEVAEHRAAQ